MINLPVTKFATSVSLLWAVIAYCLHSAMENGMCNYEQNISDKIKVAINGINSLTYLNRIE